jgi:hypothetical protein
MSRNNVRNGQLYNLVRNVHGKFTGLNLLIRHPPGRSVLTNNQAGHLIHLLTVVLPEVEIQVVALAVEAEAADLEIN